jgi:5-(carboxyamino)imidazole ribonucleotide mutase
MSGSALNGVDALYSTVQMPKGIPVATVAVDCAMNAALLVAEMLSISDEGIAKQLADHRAELAAK